MALDGVSRDQGPLAGVKPPHSASEAHALDRLDPVLFRRFADDENRRFVVARQAVEGRAGRTTACRPRRSPRAMPARSNQA